MEERLQKILSITGVCSRRTAESYIEAGRVAVNGITSHLGDKADLEQDAITLDGKPIQEKPQQIYLALNKPKGYVTTLEDEQGRPTVAHLVSGCGVRVWPVGRLDLDSEGLLLMTNDGDLTHKLIHPRHEVEKEYLVRVSGDLNRAIPQLSKPMELDGVMLRPAQVSQVSTSTMKIIIHEGKNRQVRRMCELAGVKVQMLRRIREGSLLLGALPPKQWRYLTEEELRNLKNL